MFNFKNKRKSGPEIIDIEKKDGILDELDLPPNVVKFLRTNARTIQIVSVILVVVVVGWSYYSHYNKIKQEKAAFALSSAVKQNNSTSREEYLTNVAKEYSGTAAARWSLLEEGHLAFKDGKYDDALAKYQEVYNDLSSSNPLHPLVLYAMALAQENGGKLKQALGNYQELAENKGFKNMALTAEGRIYELQGDHTNALKAYRQVADDKNLSSEKRSLIEEKINSLQASVSKATG